MAYWRRPEAYLDPVVRANISVFSLLPAAEVDAMVAALRDDLLQRRLGAAQRRAARARRARLRLSRARRGMTAAELRRRRSAAQLLAARSPADPVAAVAHLLAVQAQDLRAARLALRARDAARTAVEVDAALTGERSLVRGWLMRGTLHLVARDDYAWLHGLTAPLSATTSRRRLAQLGGDAAGRRRRRCVRALAAEGPLPRAALGERLATAGHAGRRARSCRTCSRSPLRREASSWPPCIDGGQRVRARARLARTGGRARRSARPRSPSSRGATCAATGPATDADLAAWSGLPLRDARAGLAAIAARARAERTALIDLARPSCAAARARPAAAARRVRPVPARLAATAPSRSLPSTRGASIRAAGSSAPRRSRAAAAVGDLGGAGAAPVALEPFEPLPARVSAALRRETAAVERFEGAGERRHRM